MTPRLLILICLVALAGGGLWLLLDPGTSDTPGGDLAEGDPPDTGEQAATLEGDGRPSRRSPVPEAPPPRPGSRESLEAAERNAREDTPVPLEKVLTKVRILLPDERPALGTEVMLRARDGTVVFEAEVTRAVLNIDLPPGRYELIARGPASTWLHNRSFLITGTGPDAPLDLQLQTVPELVVRVVHATTNEAGDVRGEPGAVVIAARTVQRFGYFDALRERAVHEGVTDATGRVDLGGAPRGTYVLHAKLQDGVELQFTHKHPKQDGALIRIEKRRLVPLNIIDAARRGPVPGARVHVTSSARRGGASHAVRITADRNGRAMIPLGGAGVPNLEVEADGYLAWPAGDHAERRKSLAAVRSKLWQWREEMDTPTLELVSGATGPWLVRVQTRDGTATPGVAVSFRRPNTRDNQLPEVQLTTDGQGFVELERVPNVGYRVQVATDEWHSPKFVYLDPGKPVDPDAPFVLEVEPRYTAYGRVLHPDGRAAVGARVWIGYSRPSQSVRPADETLFQESFTGADGRWRLAGLHSHAAYLFNAQWNGFRADPITSPIYRAEMPLDLVLKPAITLRIHVRELGSGNDVSGAAVTLRPKPIFNTPPRRYTADAKGIVEVEGLMPGAWEVQPASAMHLTAEWTLLELTDQRGVFEHTLSLDPGLAIAGRVEDGEGRSIEAAISLSGRPSHEGARSINRRVDADAEGYFRITGLRPGRYSVMAFIEGTERRARRSELVGGETDLVLVLK